MGYFSNGTEGEIFALDYCRHCVHGQDREKGCPIMNLHWLWNYDQFPEHAKTDTEKEVAQTKHEALENFIGDEDGQCRMFTISTHVEEPTEYPWHAESDLKPLVAK